MNKQKYNLRLKLRVVTTTIIHGLIGVFVVVIAIYFFWLLLCIRWQTSEELVSGIVYNNINNKVLSGNTRFKIRASVDTYINEDNVSSYCLPANSPYIPLIKEAAADKSIRVVVMAKKAFKIVSNPLVCLDNVTVTREVIK